VLLTFFAYSVINLFCLYSYLLKTLSDIFFSISWISMSWNYNQINGR